MWDPIATLGIRDVLGAGRDAGLALGCMKHCISCAPLQLPPAVPWPAFSGASRQSPVTPERWVAPCLLPAQLGVSRGARGRGGGRALGRGCPKYLLCSVTWRWPQLSCRMRPSATCVLATLLFNHGKPDGFDGFVQCLGPAEPGARWSLFSLPAAVMQLENKPKRFPWLLWICFWVPCQLRQPGSWCRC